MIVIKVSQSSGIPGVSSRTNVKCLKGIHEERVAVQSLFPSICFQGVFLFYADKCFNCVFVCSPHVSTWCPQRPEENPWYPGTGAANGCKLPRRFYEPNVGPLPGQQVAPNG